MSFNSNSTLAKKLLEGKHYDAAIKAVISVRQSKNSFLVIDAPSGSGKTLFGIALRHLDFVTGTCRSELIKEKMRVVHCTWSDAVADQAIYKGILDEHRQQEIDPDILFRRAKSYPAPPTGNVASEYEHHVWNHLLAPMFSETYPEENFSRKNFETKIFKAPLRSSFLVLFVDEVPDTLEGVKSIIDIREACKRLSNVVVVLAGTNAKASNMIGMNGGSASTSDLQLEDSKWALLMTRFPWFQIEHTVFHDKWEKFRHLCSHNQDANVIVEAIQTSIENGGNPRIIIFALQVLFSSTKGTGLKKFKNIKSKIRFEAWQMEVSGLVIINKFASSGFSKALHSIIGQANLMLRASPVAEMSDVLIVGHFARRFVPDLSSDVTNELRSCAGWLYLADNINRSLGNSLYYVAGDGDKLVIKNRIFSWQKTVFAPPDFDPLLYIGSCRKSGFLSLTELTGTGKGQGVARPLTVSRVLPAFWNSNSAGSLNFQNESAICNSGSKLEVGLALSICNAASVQAGRSCKVIPFIHELMKQLGTKCPSLDGCLQGLQAIEIPRMLFPYPDKLPTFLEGYVGCIQRMRNKDRCDLVIIGVGQTCIRAEAKDRDALSGDDLITAGEKLFQETNELLGILVVRNCCDYWKGGTNSNINRIRAYMSLSRNVKKIKRIIFVRDGCSRVVTFTCGRSSLRTLLVIQTNLTQF
jgi:hypothetical protein